MRTTIQLSESLRKKLKVISSERDAPYESTIEDLIGVFNSVIPFKTENEFSEWFEKNFDKLGFKEIVEKRKRSSPDFTMKDLKGKKVNVELELIGRDFERHKHNPKSTDLIVCVFSDSQIVSGVPVLPILDFPKEPEEAIKRKKGAYTTVSIPSHLYKKVDLWIKGTGFSSASDFVTFVLRDISLEIEDKEKIAKSKNRVIKKLKALGYL